MMFDGQGGDPMRPKKAIKPNKPKRSFKNASQIFKKPAESKVLKAKRPSNSKGSTDSLPGGATRGGVPPAGQQSASQRPRWFTNKELLGAMGFPVTVAAQDHMKGAKCQFSEGMED
eukprot:7657282-Alexandrium_andersonii.AAC.1